MEDGPYIAASIADRMVAEAVEAERAKAKKLVSALCFYANPNNYKGLPPGYAFVPIDKDSGALARAALDEKG
jgi:hypothetical protein